MITQAVRVPEDQFVEIKCSIPKDTLKSIQGYVRQALKAMPAEDREEASKHFDELVEDFMSTSIQIVAQNAEPGEIVRIESIPSVGSMMNRAEC